METLRYCWIESGAKSGYLSNLITVVPECVFGSTFNTSHGRLDSVPFFSWTGNRDDICTVSCWSALVKELAQNPALPP